MTGRIQGFRAKGVRKPFWALLRMQFKVQFNAAKVAESLDSTTTSAARYTFTSDSWL